MANVKAFLPIAIFLWSDISPIFSDQLIENVKYLDGIIDEVKAANAPWTAGKNFDFDLSAERLPDLVTDFDPLGDVKERGSCDYCKERLEVTGDSEFDARKKWPQCKSITHIRNQGSCNSAWAVAAAAIISDRQCIASNGTFTAAMSAQQILACCGKCGNGNGCEGGWPRRALQFYQKEGVVTGGDFGSNDGCQPFSIKPTDNFKHPDNTAPQCSKTCTNEKYPKKWRKDRHFGKEVYTPCCCSVKGSLQNEGPVVASMITYEDFFAYRSGIYQHIWGKKVGWHTVRIIGWGIDNGTEYWIGANSWGTNWGENGFFKIKRKEADIETGFVAVVPKLKKKKN